MFIIVSSCLFFSPVFLLLFNASFCSFSLPFFHQCFGGYFSPPLHHRTYFLAIFLFLFLVTSYWSSPHSCYLLLAISSFVSISLSPLFPRSFFVAICLSNFLLFIYTLLFICFLSCPKFFVAVLRYLILDRLLFLVIPLLSFFFSTHLSLFLHYDSSSAIFFALCRCCHSSNVIFGHIFSSPIPVRHFFSPTPLSWFVWSSCSFLLLVSRNSSFPFFRLPFLHYNFILPCNVFVFMPLL